MNTKSKGDIGVGQAIAYYTLNDIEVLLPIGDKKPYDLVIDRDGKLSKVQVKYTSFKSKYGNFRADLRITGGNQSFTSSKKYVAGDFDFCFIYTSVGEAYEVPFDSLSEKKVSITLSSKYEKYKL